MKKIMVIAGGDWQIELIKKAKKGIGQPLRGFVKDYGIPNPHPLNIPGQYLGP